ncbi:unnamed protein product, partial [Ectocarpus fasciculatus]
SCRESAACCASRLVLLAKAGTSLSRCRALLLGHPPHHITDIEKAQGLAPSPPAGRCPRLSKRRSPSRSGPNSGSPVGSARRAAAAAPPCSALLAGPRPRAIGVTA